MLLLSIAGDHVPFIPLLDIVGKGFTTDPSHAGGTCVNKVFVKAVEVNTEFILPPTPAKFYRQVDNQFVNGAQKNRLSETQYDSVKNDFMNSADMKLILTSLNLKKDFPTEDVFLVKKETEVSNDNKVFKKIPAICSQLGVETINVQQLIEKFEGISLEIK